MIKKRIKRLIDILIHHISTKVADTIDYSAEQQINLICNFKLAASNGSGIKLQLKDVGFGKYSQHDEDGILLYIFSLIETTNKQCVEICAGNGLENNTTNLIINHRWTGLLFDGNENNVITGKNFFNNHPSAKYWPPIFKCEWITKENINQLISENGIHGEIDLLSLDIDGNDYWILQEIEVIKPRVIVLEFNHLWGPKESVSVPYQPDFKAEFTKYGSDYAGASLTAFVKLCESKGYRLVGTNSISTNAFFIRNDIRHNLLPEVKPEECFSHPRAIFGMKNRLEGIKNKEWQKV